MTDRQASRRTGQAGVSLVELLVSMIIFSIVTTMLIVGWISLQSSSAQTVNADDARSTARDALTRISSEIRGAQPSPGATAGSAVFTVANQWEVDFYSSYNQPGTSADGTGTGTLALTRIYLGNSDGTTPPLTTAPYQKNVYWQRDTAAPIGSFTSADRSVVLATNVVNTGLADTSVTPNTTYTALFRYATRDTTSGNLVWTDNNDGSLNSNLAKIVAVNVRLIIDANLNHTPTRIDLQTLVSPRNAPQS